MSSILDLSDQFLENLVAELNHPEHAAIPNTEFDNVEENLYEDLSDVLDSLASPLNVAFHNVDQNLSVLNLDNDNISCRVDGNITDDAEKAAQGEVTSQDGQNLSHIGYINLDKWSHNRNVGVDTMQAEQAPCEITSKIVIINESGCSSSNIDCEDGGGSMRAEKTAPSELTPQVGPSLIDLGCVNHDSDTSSCNVSCNGTTKLNSLCDPTLKQKKCNAALRDEIPPVLPSHVCLDPKRKNSANESNASVTGAHTLKVQHCEPSVGVAIKNHQMEDALPHGRTAMSVDSIEQSEDASQLDECQDQIIGKSFEIPLKNTGKGRRKLDRCPHLKEPKSHTCAECGKQFRKKSELTKHLWVHTGEKPYKCAQCDYASTRATDVARHESTHSDARPFICLICNRAFKLSTYLDVHQSSHSDVRPFECLTCHATFKRKHALTDHQRTHSGTEFTCDICKKPYRRKKSMMDHQNIHTGTMPYECNMCNKTFYRKSSLHSHRMRCTKRRRVADI